MGLSVVRGSLNPPPPGGWENPWPGSLWKPKKEFGLGRHMAVAMDMPMVSATQHVAPTEARGHQQRGPSTNSRSVGVPHRTKLRLRQTGRGTRYQT